MARPRVRAESGEMLDPDWLLTRLRALAPQPGVLRCCVALSGGLDSTVLLHLLWRARKSRPREVSLRALHVDHHLQPASRAFRAHARALARHWRVPCTVLDVQVDRGGSSPEEAARQARYTALGGALRDGELLLTAQHADDQLETLLLALMRGSGPAGLAGMPAAMALGAGRLVRPLLDVERAAIAAYAREWKLDWIEDPTNADLRPDRNYLRAEVLPALRRRWPAAARTAARAARHSAALQSRERERAARDLELAADGEGLQAAVLRRWPPARQSAALRAWCQQLQVRVPDERRLGAALSLLEVREDASPALRWPGACLRLHQGRLLLSREERGGAGLPGDMPTDAQRWSWRRQPALRLAGRGTLSLRADAHGDIDLARVPASLWVRWPRTGQARGAGRGERSLRKRLQSLGVPAWERDALPLVAGPGGADSRVVAIADLWADQSLLAGPRTRRRGRFVWRRGE